MAKVNVRIARIEIQLNNYKGNKTMKLFLRSLVLFLFFFGGISMAAYASPTSDLEPVLKDLTDVLADETLKGSEHLVERREKIMSQIKRGFDFREMSKRVVGKTWKTLQEKDRSYFTELMTKLLENVYIGKLEGYSGQGVEYVDEKVKGNRAQVSTMVLSGEAKIPVHYMMKNNNETWMVYDINIEGVSLIRNYRQQFKSILKKDKFAGLVKELEDKNRSFLEIK